VRGNPCWALLIVCSSGLHRYVRPHTVTEDILANSKPQNVKSDVSTTHHTHATQHAASSRGILPLLARNQCGGTREKHCTALHHKLARIKRNRQAYMYRRQALDWLARFCELMSSRVADGSCSGVCASVVAVPTATKQATTCPASLQPRALNNLVRVDFRARPTSFATREGK
jgi:hypothetical protein